MDEEMLEDREGDGKTVSETELTNKSLRWRR
jgi:hypothetical protein